MDLLLWVVLFLVVAVIITYLIKRFTKQETYYIVSLIRTKKPLPLFDKLARLGRVLELFSTIGLVLGFGAIAVDYLFGRKLNKPKRIILFLFSIFVLSFVFVGIDLLLNNFISKSPFTKDIFYLIAIVFGFSGFAGFTILALINQAVEIIFKLSIGESACPGVAPLIPGVKIPNVPIVVPLHAWISLLIILVIHEGMHGIVARRENLPIKSTGLLLLGFLPIGAFVEPDEKVIEKTQPIKALRMLAAGPTANLAAMAVIQLFVIFLVILLLLFVSPWAAPIRAASVKGVAIASVDQNMEFCGTIYDNPAYGQVDKNWVIKRVNDRNVSTIAHLQLEISQHRFEPITLLLETPEGNLVERTLVPNELGSFGFGVKEIPNESYPVPLSYKIFSFALGLFEEFINWLFILNLLIAIVNFLPMPPFDGGRIVKILLLPYFAFLKMEKKDTEKFIGRLFLYFVLILLMINALPLFL